MPEVEDVDLINDIIHTHSREYEIPPKSEKIIVAEAPGRIHYLGEQCQSGAGMYLSSAIDRLVRVAVSARKDNSLRFYTAELSERKRATIANTFYKREDRWANHVKLAICLFEERGFQIKGMNFTISSAVPQNIGLAAASAIEMAAAIALRRFLNCGISDSELIKSLDAVHKKFYPGEDRIVDFLVMLNAKKDCFLGVDESSKSVRLIKNPFLKHKILVIDSKVPYISAEEELRTRRADLNRGLEILSKKRQIKSFRDIIGADMLEIMSDLGEEVEVHRRCMHAVKEAARVEESISALESGEIQTVSKNIYHSHESLRDLYEVTCPELDWLVKRAQEIEGILGARMTGSGFGGCVYALIPLNLVDEYLARMEDYERIFGFRVVIHEVKPAGGARLAVK